MATTVAILASLGFIGWLIIRAFRGKPFKAHTVTYGVAVVAGVFTYAYFLSMSSIPQLVKIVASILLGMVLIVLAALLQRRRAANRS